MTVLRSDINARTNVLPVDAPMSSPTYPLFRDLGSETVKVVDGADTTEWQVERGVLATEAARHSKGTTLISNVSPYTSTTFDVQAYGATGDGVTDDTTAVRAAIAAAAGGRGRCYFPSGTYIVQPLTIPPGVILEGASGQAYYNATTTVPNSATIAKLKLKAASASPLISPDDTGTNKATSVIIRDLALDCNALTQPAINLPDQGTSITRFWLIDRVYISNIGGASGYAVYIGNQNAAVTMRDSVTFNGTSGSAAGHDGIGWYGPDGRMENSYVGYFSGTGLTLIGGASDITFSMRGGGLFTCTTGAVVGAAGGVFQAVSIDHNLNDGIYIGNGPVFIEGCTFHSNSRTTNNTWSHININAASVQATVVGCRVAPLDADAGSNNAKYFINTNGQSGVVLNEHGNFKESVTLVTGWTDYVGTTTAPAFPASTVAVTNTTGADITAFIANSSAAITAIVLGSTTTGMTIAISGTAAIRIPQGQKIAFTYASGTPTWTWVIG